MKIFTNIYKYNIKTADMKIHSLPNNKNKDFIKNSKSHIIKTSLIYIAMNA